jgi:hypothetical protein
MLFLASIGNHSIVSLHHLNDPHLQKHLLLHKVLSLVPIFMMKSRALLVFQRSERKFESIC